MPEDWNLSMICPILKKGDATVRTNYRGISLLPVAYKVLTSVLCERLKPHAEALIGPYQCGFRPGKSTVDQIFTLRQILEKSYENQIDTYHLFVDYKAAFDSPRRDRLYAAMSSLGVDYLRATPKFSEAITLAGPLRDLFTALYIQNPRLSEVEKLFYLNSKTSGEAHSIVSKSPLTNEGFQSAWSSLTERFENKRLFNLPAIGQESGSSILELQSTIQGCLTALEHSKIN
ncbi:uncharacterized protein LOC132797512, partial [Drosophila nasuta]|uniref:uncharacterized protein LOC132797512 n=1 Tax=Drosophila nasuta TaxID=42062 RepID=UPI00295E60AE